MIAVDNFSLQYGSAKRESDEDSPNKNIPIFTFVNFYELVRFIGYAKYININEKIFLRGQTRLHSSMAPSLYRDVKNIDRVYKGLSKEIKRLREAGILLSDSKAVTYSLLQHYGLKTPYLDVVDNIWTALWFATHTATSTVVGTNEHINYSNSTTDFSYILLIATDAMNEIGASGVYEGSETELVDLRKAAPSIFLRPHLQHAYTIKGKENMGHDLSNRVTAIAEFPTNLGLEWLGTNALLTARALFPPVQYDIGYRRLLSKYQVKPGNIKTYGSIQIVS